MDSVNGVLFFCPNSVNGGLLVDRVRLAETVKVGWRREERNVRTRGNKESGDEMRQAVTTEMLLTAVMAATPARKESALLVLRGEAAVADASGPMLGRRGMPEPYVGLKEVAEFAGVSKRSVKRWGVPARKFGGRLRFRLTEVAAYLESGEFKARLEELRASREARPGDSEP